MRYIRSSQKHTLLFGTPVSQLLYSSFAPAGMALLFGLFFIQSGIRAYIDVESIRSTMPLLTEEDYRELLFRSMRGYRELILGIASVCIGFCFLLVWTVKKTRLDYQQISQEQ